MRLRAVTRMSLVQYCILKMGIPRLFDCDLVTAYISEEATSILDQHACHHPHLSHSRHGRRLAKSLVPRLLQNHQTGRRRASAVPSHSLLLFVSTFLVSADADENNDKDNSHWVCLPYGSMTCSNPYSLCQNYHHPYNIRRCHQSRHNLRGPYHYATGQT